ncbi:MAG: MATE family efflux transporter [Proteobacteria bacterium]|nr:MATE family efflux transporter [Pseudomonadota bacterium]
MVVQIGVAVSEAWVVARVGVDALAGIALVIPFITLMMNMANGGMGGGVAAALARALGGGRAEDAKALLLHALVLAAAMALLFGVFAWTALPTIFQWLGGTGDVLDQALAFSRVWFSGTILLWIQPFLSALLRGAGNAATPSRIGVVMSLVYIPLLAVLTLGVGSWSGLGLAGSAIAPLITGAVSAALLAHAIARGRLGFMPRFAGVRLQLRLFGEILRVGAMGSITTVTATMTAMLVTGLVARFGTAALAGYSIGMRLEFMVAPLAFGIGAGATTLVGIAAGAHDWRRAVRVAWVAGMTAFVLIGVIGWTVGLIPETWSRLFATQPEVIAASIACIVRVAPFYCLFGLGLTLNFASQGAGRMTVPVAASVSRLAIAAGGGWFAIEHLSLGLEGVFGAIGASLVVYGGLIAGSLLVAPWRSQT